MCFQINLLSLPNYYYNKHAIYFYLVCIVTFIFFFYGTIMIMIYDQGLSYEKQEVSSMAIQLYQSKKSVDLHSKTIHYLHDHWKLLDHIIYWDLLHQLFNHYTHQIRMLTMYTTWLALLIIWIGFILSNYWNNWNESIHQYKKPTYSVLDSALFPPSFKPPQHSLLENSEYSPILLTHRKGGGGGGGGRK